MRRSVFCLMNVFLAAIPFCLVPFGFVACPRHEMIILVGSVHRGIWNLVLFTYSTSTSILFQHAWHPAKRARQRDPYTIHTGK